MVNKCNCYSLIQKSCPRGVFDCHRCLAKMKNAGIVWEIDVPQIDFTYFTAVDAFIQKLYFYDGGFLAFFTPPENVIVADIKCVSGTIGRQILSDIPLTTTFYRVPGNTLQAGVAQITAGLYFETVWRLWLRYDQVFDGFGMNPGGSTFLGNGFMTVEAHYDSEQSNCFLWDPVAFNLVSTDGVSTSYTLDLVENVFVPSYVFPEVVTFRHVYMGNFDPNADFR